MGSLERLTSWCVSLGACVLFSSAGKLTSIAWPQAAPKTSQGTRDKDVRSLEAAGWKLVELFKNGDRQDLPALCWRNGVTVDLGGTTVSPKALGKMIAKKGWFYCAYFESACTGQRREQSRKTYSYRDLLLKAPEIRLNASTRIRGEHKRGVVTLKIDGGPAKEQLEKQDYNFIYILDAGEWKITCFECDLKYWTTASLEDLACLGPHASGASA
jgi:hypothetical protein